MPLSFLTKESPAELRARDKAAPASSISAHYSADLVMNRYAGCEGAIPGYLMHGWYPPHFNREPRFVAALKGDEDGGDPRERIEREKQTHPQWVGRHDQVETLRKAGHRHVAAIGLPFAYLPEIQVERRPGSLLIMPPHGQKKFFHADLARVYAGEIASMKDRFSEIYACVTLRDFYRGEWRPQFEEVGIPVFYGAGPSEPNALLRMKEILSTFEFVTTNAFGSQIAYAAHCGAKVSVYGPFVEWPVSRTAYSTSVYPELAQEIVDLQSEAMMGKEMPFLFRRPDEAEIADEWGDWQIGLNHKRTAPEISDLFGWQRP
jgi:hypothetical protein